MFVTFLREMQSGPSGTECAENTRSIDSPSQDKDTQRALFLNSLLKGMLSFQSSTDSRKNK
jgi:hypothetical protein